MPPDTVNYMVLGYAVVVLIVFGMILFFANRTRHLRAELKMLEDLDRESSHSTNKG